MCRTSLFSIFCLIACTCFVTPVQGQTAPTTYPSTGAYPNSGVVRASEAPVGRVSAAAYYMAYRENTESINSIRARRTFVAPQSSVQTSVQNNQPRPFQDINPLPTVSPYLGLNEVEFDAGTPNYHTLVRPRLEQQQQQISQARQARNEQRQNRSAVNRGATARRSLPSIPTTGSSTAQFLNTGNYFPPVRR